MVGRGADLETAVAVKDLALRMGNAAVYKEGGIAGEDYPNHLKLTDVDEVRERSGRTLRRSHASIMPAHFSSPPVYCF